MCNQPIISFCHIIKCSGTTLTSIFRRNNGINQISALPRPGKCIYGSEEMMRDVKIFPNIKSISGHGLRPYINYGLNDDRLIWFTWFRNPLTRLISDYQHSVEKGGRNVSFEKWLQEPDHRNLQVMFLTGSEDDLEGAMDVVSRKMKFVGLVETFNESLILLKSRLSLTDYNIDYPKIANASLKGKVAVDLYSDLDKYSDLIDKNISVDMQLYNWFVDEVYPGYVKDFGKKNLEDELKKVFIRADIPNVEKMREFSNNFLRRAIYKPILRRL